MWSISKTEEHKATFDGSVTAHLTGGDSGFSWSGLGSIPAWMTAPGPAIPAEVSTEVNESLKVLTKILGFQVTTSCTGIVANKALLEAEGKGSGSLTFSGCQTSLNGEVSAACEPRSGEKLGVVTTNSLKGQLALHEGSTVLQLLPVTGETFATVESTKVCAVGAKVPLIGKFYVKDKNGKFEAEGAEHVFEVGPLTEMWSISKTEEHKATFDGSVTAHLTGGDSGFSWSGLGA
jgi:hypothetical protein